MGDYDINFDPDQSYISNLGGRSYMAAVSPWFFTVRTCATPIHIRNLSPPPIAALRSEHV